MRQFRQLHHRDRAGLFDHLFLDEPDRLCRCENRCAVSGARALRSEDLAPATKRKWGAFSIFNVWTSDVHSLWGYYLAASLFLLCGSFVNFIIAIGLGSLIIFFLMNLIGYAGVKTGVPYPVLARSDRKTWRQLPNASGAPSASLTCGPQTCTVSGATISRPASSCYAAVSSTSSSRSGWAL